MPSSSPRQVTREEFDRWVHDVLNRLYDSPYLEEHPLAKFLVPTEQPGLRRSHEIRRLLLAAVQSLHPAKGTPEHSPDWRGYHILEQRFISALTPNEVMLRLGISRSLFFAEQARVLKSLTDVLWRQAPSATLTPPPAEPEQAPSPIEAEFLRLLEQATWESLNLSTLVEELAPVIQVKAHASQVQVTFDLSQTVIIEHADRVLLRQVILNLAAQFIELSPSSSMVLRTVYSPRSAGLEISILLADGRSLTLPLPVWLCPEVCVRVLAAMDCDLKSEIGPAGEPRVHLTWLVRRSPRSLLVIDDNKGIIELFQRYLANTSWEITGVVNGDQARQAMEAGLPDLIVLDVILPFEDGWELLLTLKGDPYTCDIPVIVCSALDEAQLALSLGAASYLSKPVTQPALLQALRPWNRSPASPAPEH